jgi:hypothetical protein
MSRPYGKAYAPSVPYAHAPCNTPTATVAAAKLVAGVLVLIAPAVSFAHHSFSMFDVSKSITLEGVIKDFRWTNPHAFIQLLTAGPNGEEEWSIELTSPEHLARAGWRHGTLKVGDKVTLVVHPVRDGTKGGQYVSGTGPDGAPIGTPLQAHGGGQ